MEELLAAKKTSGVCRKGKSGKFFQAWRLSLREAARTRQRRPQFYQSLRKEIPNGLLSLDGSGFTVWLDKEPYTFHAWISSSSRPPVYYLPGQAPPG